MQRPTLSSPSMMKLLNMLPKCRQRSVSIHAPRLAVMSGKNGMFIGRLTTTTYYKYRNWWEPTRCR